jgi:hypothetical protein
LHAGWLLASGLYLDGGPISAIEKLLRSGGRLTIACALCAMNWTAVFCALLSAALFGVSTPAAKALVGSVHPAVLAGLLYCGAGTGIALIRRALPWVVSGLLKFH